MKAKKYYPLLFVFFLFLLFRFPVQAKTASADMGPKPSLRITFAGLPKDEECYAAVLSSVPSTGPHSAYTGEYEPREEGDVARIFREYQDKDGFYYLQYHFDLAEKDGIYWGYYPPYTFKVLLYFPRLNLFVSSDVYERYAFDSYFHVDMTDIQLPVEPVSEQAPILLEETLTAVKSYDYTAEILFLVLRICLTILLELAVAFVFLFRDKKQWLFLAIVNILTQVVLNVYLYLVLYNSGEWMYYLFYFLGELIVFGVESVAYMLFMNKFTDKKRSAGLYIGYAAIANGFSFIVGLLLGAFFPSLF